ncbi:hypothetical protein BASA81_012742 [Batrachochytrium salamandrivorans]|nr:hypothetical protein BASA81_012742 [Batrachochytrium salamandrivorans]
MNHQQRTQDAQQTIAMIEGLNATPAQKNVLFNLVGVNYHVASIVAANDMYSAQGLRSPLAQIGSTLNINFSQDVPPTPEIQPPTPIGQ